MRTFTTAQLLDGLSFAEGPRWRDGKLWFSDIGRNQVLTVDETGHTTVIAEIESPSGLGFLPDGALLVASLHARQLFRVDVADVTLFADLRDMGISLNDMVVDAAGRVYVDCYRPGPPFEPKYDAEGFPKIMADDINRYYSNGLGISPSLIGDILLVSPDGGVRKVAADIEYPNGLAISQDGKTLVVSVSHQGMLLAFRILPDGSLTDRRIWADLPGRHPDGVCFDAEGAIWVGSVANSAFLRVLEGGQITHQIPTPGRWAVSPALGGTDRRTLFMISMEEFGLPSQKARIETARVDIPGAGLP